MVIVGAAVSGYSRCRKVLAVMRNAPFKTKLTLGLLACGLFLLSVGGLADVRLTQVQADARIWDLSAGDTRNPAPLTIHSTVQSVRFHFTEANTDGKPTARLRTSWKATTLTGRTCR